MKEKKKNYRLILFVVLATAVIVPFVIGISRRLEGNLPRVSLDAVSLAIGTSRTITGNVEDTGSGIRKIWIALFKDGKQTVLFEHQYPGSHFFSRGDIHREAFRVTIEPKKLGLTDGNGLLRIAVWDYSWRNWAKGNRSYIEKPVTIDTRRPEIEIISGTTNISQGGSAMVIYRLSEPCPKNGVVVGDNFFPGYADAGLGSHLRVALFALRHDQGPGTEIYLQAVDAAGNQTRAGFPHYIRRHRFREDRINISDSFLNWKMPEFNVKAPADAANPLLAKFLIVNRKVRKANNETIMSVTRHSVPEKLWKGVFLQLPGGATRSEFADHRTYYYHGQKIDHEYHLGVDQARVEHTPIPAANRGRVAFTGRIGIYGRAVIIDHGFGLFSLYGHMNSIRVKVGDMVDKGTIIGRTGTTGMAGGDHLHISMIVHDTFVNPLEWWDPVWLKNNITSKLEAVSARAG